jgi:hypothetical protein
MSAALKYEPLFLSEDQEREELEQTLGQVGHRTPAEIDSFASELLGSLGRCEADLQRYTEAENAEIARIRFRYARFRAPIQTRQAMLEGAICALAKQQDFGPKKKSRETANGTYGRKTKAAHLFIDDQDALLAWSLSLPLDKGPAVTTEYSIKQKDAQAYYEKTGCEMPGCRIEKEKEIPFARPDIKGPNSGLSR